MVRYAAHKKRRRPKKYGLDSSDKKNKKGTDLEDNQNEEICLQTSPKKGRPTKIDI